MYGGKVRIGSKVWIGVRYGLGKVRIGVRYGLGKVWIEVSGLG